jgi:hypothetical protein
MARSLKTLFKTVSDNLSKLENKALYMKELYGTNTLLILFLVY